MGFKEAFKRGVFRFCLTFCLTNGGCFQKISEPVYLCSGMAHLVPVASERLGHEGVDITMNIYAHVLPDMQDEHLRSCVAGYAGGSGGEVGVNLVLVFWDTLTFSKDPPDD